MERTITRSARGIPTSDGAGVKLTRVIGGGTATRSVGPFLMLDEFRSDQPKDYLAGFPDHPHRGFETFTYIVAGKFRHHDNKGHEGVVGAGGGQWMTAGRGIVHSEMPEQEKGLAWGFQLWINLPAAEKMRAPAYEDLKPNDIPIADLGAGARAKVVAGRVGDVVGPIGRDAYARSTEPFFVEVELPAGGEARVPVPASHEAFVYPFDGGVVVGDRSLARGELGVLSAGDAVVLRAKGAAPARVLVVAGKPLDEPVVQYGPFVMNTVEQIEEAIRDFSRGAF